MKAFLHNLTLCLIACPLAPVIAWGQATSATQDAPYGTMSTATLLDCSGLPCVEIVLTGGRHLKMGIDTGNPSSYLNAKVADEIGLKQTPYLDSHGKEVPGIKVTTLPGVALGSGSLGDVKVAIFDLSDQIGKGTFPQVDGALAYGLFKQRVLRLDYAKNLLSYSALLSSKAACPVSTCGKISFIPFGQHGPPIVVASGFTLNGNPLQVQIDTMFAGTMLVFPTSIGKLGLASVSQPKKVRHFPYTDEGVDMPQAEGFREGFGTATLLQSGPLYFAGPQVHLPDGLFDGTVGQELFAKHRLTLDFKGMNVWLD